MSHLLPAGHILTLSTSFAFGRRPGFRDPVPRVPTRGAAAAVKAGRRTLETGCTRRPLMAAVSFSGSAPGPAPRPSPPGLGLRQQVCVKSPSSSRRFESSIPGFITREAELLTPHKMRRRAAGRLPPVLDYSLMEGTRPS